MISKLVVAPSTPASVYTLIGGQAEYASRGISFQAAVANAAVVNFGNAAAQYGFISPGGSSAILPISSTQDAYLKGNGTDLVAIFIW